MTADSATRGTPSNWWIVPALLFVLAGTIASNHDLGRGAPAVPTLLAVSATLSLLLVRSQPVTALLANAVLVGAYFALGYADGPVFLVVPAATFLVGVAYPVRRWLVAAPTAVLFVAAGLVTRGLWWEDQVEKALWQSLAVAAMVAAAGAVAVAIHGRRQTAAERGQRAAAEEQLRMAQDLHDGVGHGLAVIALQSGVALHLLDKNDIDRVAARRALEVIRETSRESLQSLRAELSRLAPGVPAARAAHRGLDDLPVLLDRFRAGGLTVELADGRGPVPDPVDEAAYVIVQEALTNVLRHASGHRAVVELRTGADGLVVSVTDDGPGDSLVEGLGISGMRARAQRLGGTLDVGRTPDGFQVRAVLPLGGPA